MNDYSNKPIDTDDSIKYETNNATKEAVNFFLVPLLNSLPQFLKLAVRKTHKSADDVIKYKTSHRTLKIL